MLLMAFSGLFSRMETDEDGLLEAARCIHVPSTWARIDIIQQARQVCGM
jgi:hypothetical protein